MSDKVAFVMEREGMMKDKEIRRSEKRSSHGQIEKEKKKKERKRNSNH